MPIRFACPNCGADYTINDAAAGQEMDCPACDQRLIIPTPPPAPLPVAVYIPPAEPAPVAMPARPYVPVEPPERRVVIREQVHFVYQERGNFLSAFGQTLGEGCGCFLTVVMFLLLGIGGIILFAVLAHHGQ